MFRKTSILSLFAFLALSLSALAQDGRFEVPEQKILGADRVIKLGKLVTLRVSPVTKAPEHYVSSSYAWKVYDIGYDANRQLGIIEIEDAMPSDNGTSVFFGAGVENKKFLAQCIAVHSYAVKDKDGKITEVANKVNVISTDVLIGGPAPGPQPPGPGPNPNPNPTPSFPEGRFKLAATAYKMAMEAVPPANRARGAEAVGRGFTSTASAIAAGTVTAPNDILLQAKQTNNNNLRNATPPISITEWDAFGSQLQTYLVQLNRDRKLATASDFADAFREIAEGLAQVR